MLLRFVRYKKILEFVFVRNLNQGGRSVTLSFFFQTFSHYYLLNFYCFKITKPRFT